MHAEPIVLCPLEFERRVLQRAGLGERCRLECCGPGGRAIDRWADRRTPEGPVILCGLAGSASDSYDARTAHVPAAVVADDGRRLEPTWGAGSAPGPLIGSADATLTTPQAKRDWARCSGADLVDQESAAFALAAAAGGWRWTIVRGVGDGPETALPEGIDAWVDDRGRTRFAAVCRAVARRRAGIRQLIRLRSDGTAAMRAAAAIIRRMLDDLDGSSP
ncbi:MAG: nucleoside phosphorylase-I family protein [Planctomycetota bacterium]